MRNIKNINQNFFLLTALTRVLRDKVETLKMLYLWGHHISVEVINSGGSINLRKYIVNKRKYIVSYTGRYRNLVICVTSMNHM